MLRGETLLFIGGYAQTHQVLLDTHQLASRALFFPTLPPTTGKKDKNKKRKKQLKPQANPKQ